MAIDPRVVAEAVAQLRRGAGQGLTAALGQVCDAAVGLFGVSGSGMMLIDENQDLRSVAATDDAGQILEDLQAEVGEGPCVDTLILDTIVTTTDVSTDARWTQLGPRIAETDVRAVLGVPARAAGGAIGAFNVYRSHPHEWDESEIHALESFNSLVEALIGSALLADAREAVVEQLQFALDNRVNIERAVGVIMARDNLDPVGAFNRLRSQARAERRKVVDLASEILSGFNSDR